MSRELASGGNSQLITQNSQLLRFILLYDEVVDDEVLALHRVLSHIEFEEVHHGVVLAQGDALETHLLADEVLELVGRYLTETFESGNLGVGTKLRDGLEALLLGVAVAGDEVALALTLGFILLLVTLDEAFPVAHAEERRL